MKTKEENISFDIDYDSFTKDEIIKIIEFFNQVTLYVDGKISSDYFLERYNEYRKILNSPSFEKRYDKMYFDQTGISIYKLIKEIKNNK